MNRQVWEEWPLIVFTLLLQVSCGLAVAVTVGDVLHVSEATRSLRPLGIAIFPVVAAGLLASMVHLGRPFAGWRGLSNFPHSKLSREILLVLAFSMSAFASSGLWWLGGSMPHGLIDAVTSLLGINVVIASAAIYTMPSKPLWNSGWVLTSFIGSTVTVSGLALSSILPSPVPGSWIAGTGIFLLLISNVWMGIHTFPRLQDATYLWISAASLVVLLLGVLLLLLFLPSPSAFPWFTGAILVTALALISTRVLMFAMTTLQPPF